MWIYIMSQTQCLHAYFDLIINTKLQRISL